MESRKELNEHLIEKAIDYLFIDRKDLFAEYLAILFTNCYLEERIAISLQLGDYLVKKIVGYKNDTSKFAF